MENESYQGYAAALGDLIRLTTIDDIQAREVLDTIGVTKQDLIRAGVEDFDLDEIFEVSSA